MATFSESSYRFTDPIRYFKANDPIYYEVDNIPLKQLQENNLWLKDQLSKLEYNQIFNTSNITNTTNNFLQANRSGFSELQPYVNGSNNTVYVRPGRFTARINDVLNLQPLQVISRLTDDNFLDSFSFKTNRDGTVRSILNKFKDRLQANSMGMNGLIERAFTRASRNINDLSQFLNSTDPKYLNIPIAGAAEIPYPTTVGQTYIYNLAVSSANSKVHDDLGGFIASNWHESNWIKKWRGVARTSVVDVPSELSIEIPPFDSNDFYYINENGVRQTLTAATQRIDLLFVYSKPVDASAATVAKYLNQSSNPTKIYSPQLGIVKGAGIGLNLDNRTFNVNSPLNAVNLQDEQGNQMIVPSISDELGQNIGFSGVKGSFPSPDDLMNIAPTLVESLEDNNINLLGQSILPIAYIVVKKDTSLNANSVNILNSNDIVDIRPFFRTTELAYNERAGIAAAHPQISLGNPVATENYVDIVAKRLSERIDVLAGNSGGGTGGGNEPPPPPATPTYTPRVVYSGKIYGGWGTWGPEYTLLKYIKTKYPNLSTNQAYDKLRQELFYEVPIQDGYPTWDYAHWAIQLLSQSQQIGTKIGDYVNFVGYIGTAPTSTNNTGSIFNPNNVSYLVAPSFLKEPKYGSSDTSLTNRSMYGATNLHWVSKTFKINNQEATWIYDLDVRVEFLNCTPATRSGASIYTTKEVNPDGTVEIGIHVAWEGTRESPERDRDLLTPVVSFLGTQTGSLATNPFLVTHPGITRSVEGLTSYKGYSNYGTCRLPTVSFDIIGYPQGWRQNQFFNTRYYNTVINLK